MSSLTMMERRTNRILFLILAVSLAISAATWAATANGCTVIIGPLWSESIQVIVIAVAFCSACILLFYNSGIWNQRLRKVGRTLVGIAVAVTIVIVFFGSWVLFVFGFLSTIREYTVLDIPGAQTQYVALEVSSGRHTFTSLLTGSGILYRPTIISIPWTTDDASSFRDGDYRVAHADGHTYLVHGTAKDSSDVKVLLPDE